MSAARCSTAVCAQARRAAKAAPTNGATKKAKTAAKKSAFHPEVENLLDIIYDSTSKAVASGLSSSAGATKDAPLGNLSDKQLDKGADILDEIEKLTNGGKAKQKELVELTNDYLSNIPRQIDHARKGKKLDEETIRHELEGNICRCTGYHNIVKAIQAGAENM